MVDIDVVRIFCSVVKCRKEKTAFWFAWFVIACYRTDCADDVFVDLFGFPEAFVVGCFEGNIVSIMKEVYSIVVVGVIVFCDVFVKGFQKGIVFETTGFESEEQLVESTRDSCFFGNVVAFEVLVSW